MSSRGGAGARTRAMAAKDMSPEQNRAMVRMKDHLSTFSTGSRVSYNPPYKGATQELARYGRGDLSEPQMPAKPANLGTETRAHQAINYFESLNAYAMYGPGREITGDARTALQQRVGNAYEALRAARVAVSNRQQAAGQRETARQQAAATRAQRAQDTQAATQYRSLLSGQKAAGNKGFTDVMSGKPVVYRLPQGNIIVIRASNVAKTGNATFDQTLFHSGKDTTSSRSNSAQNFLNASNSATYVRTLSSDWSPPSTTRSSTYGKVLDAYDMVAKETTAAWQNNQNNPSAKNAAFFDSLAAHLRTMEESVLNPPAPKSRSKKSA